MNPLQKTVRRAHRWLMFQQYVRAVTWCWCAALAAVGVMAAADWLLGWGLREGLAARLGVDVDASAGGSQFVLPALLLLVAGVALGCLVAAAWTFAKRISFEAAAIELDHRFGLKERVSSALALSPAERESAAGAALLEDASRRVQKLDVAHEFRLRLDHWSALPLVPAALAFLLCLFLPLADDRAAGEQEAAAKIDKQAVREQVAPLLKKIAKQKQQAQEQGRLERAAEFDKLEKQIEQSIAKHADPREAAVELNSAVKDYQQRRKELGQAEDLKKQLGQLNDFDQGPAEKLAKAVKDGNFQQAAQEIEKLRKQLEEGGLDQKQKQNLAKQLDQMQRKLQDLANAAKNSPQAQDLKQQLREAQKNGDQQRADDLQKQLDQLPPQGEQSRQLEQMAQALKQCAECSGSGQPQQAADALQGMQDQLSDLQKQLDQLGSVDDALEQFSEIKNALLSDQAGKQGEGKQPGDGQGQGRPDGEGRGDGEGLPAPGGLGAGQGTGRRPENKDTPFKTVDSKAPSKTSRGAAIVVGEAPGPNLRGEIREAIDDSLRTGPQEDSDPLDVQSLPKSYRQQVEEYFRALREGE